MVTWDMTSLYFHVTFFIQPSKKRVNASFFANKSLNAVRDVLNGQVMCDAKQRESMVKKLQRRY